MSEKLIRWAERLRLKETLALFSVNMLCISLVLYGFEDRTIPFSFVVVGKTFDVMFEGNVAILSVLGISVAILAIFIVRHRTNLDMRRLLAAVLTGEVGSLFGLVAFIFGIAYIGWITDYLREREPFYAIISFELLLVNIEVFILLLKGREVESSPMREEPEPKKILIFALSKPNSERNLIHKVICALWEIELRKLKEQKFKDSQRSEKPKSSEENKKTKKSGQRLNWEVPLRSIVQHISRLERIYVLVSPKSGMKYGEFEKGILFFLESRGKEVKMESSQPLDFNNYGEILTALSHLIAKAKMEGYSDDDFSFNISGGTSAVTAALIIAAIKEGRQVEYVTQEPNSKLKRIDVNEIQVNMFLGKLGVA
ncbi:MAG: hypothetical protein GXO39_04850 [Thermotogae bacterium]|nr:hypothetical protein [Thermotogota bacterium]